MKLSFITFIVIFISFCSEILSKIGNKIGTISFSNNKSTDFLEMIPSFAYETIFLNVPWPISSGVKKS